ncbi:MAG TPA: PHP domain-containing protein [Bryobacteraceae bacterium]|nr:PHP domain-containing protein [Bryobacteraceae bacterium]
MAPITHPFSNAAIADKLASLAQLMAIQKENPFKVKAYRRAATRIRSIAEGMEDMVHSGEDLTAFAGIGDAIAAAIREIVLTGSLGKLDRLRADAPAGAASIGDYPRLDARRVMRIYKKLGIDSIDALRQRLEAGEIERHFGARMSQHISQGLGEPQAMLLYHADPLQATIEEYLLGCPGVKRVEAAGAGRRRVETVERLVFVVETNDFPALVSRMQRFGGDTPLLSQARGRATFRLAAGIVLDLRQEEPSRWGLRMIACTGSATHLRKLRAVGPFRELAASRDAFADEAAVYARFGLDYIVPELREGRDEVERARSHSLPALVTGADIVGELHAHSTSSDGSNSIEDMAAAARALGYRYLGITDHSQSLKIARGVSIADLRAQIRFIDKLNARLTDFHILKSSEVDILADGSLDYPDELLAELDYTVCSIHSRFGLGREAQTERILRAMDNRRFNILGHATGRLLLKRPGYEIDIERLISHAKETGCFFEINSSPDRLDLPAEYARSAALAGVRIAISTDAHSTREFPLIRHGIDQARRAGLERKMVINCLAWDSLMPLFRR